MTKTSLFPFGQVVMTRTVQAWLAETDRTPLVLLDLLARHATGDWGDLDRHDQTMNEQAVRTGERILSAYHVDDTKLWIITEADRSSTTILFPSDY